MIGSKGLSGFFYIKWKEGESELDNRERACMRGRASRQGKDSVGNKTDH
jgi:hypothetical protein